MRFGSAVEQIGAGLDALAAADVVTLDDATVRARLLALTTLTNRLHAELVRHVDVFDRRDLGRDDGFRTTKTWLQAFARMPAVAAHRLVKAARLLRRLPKLATATQTGDVPAEHVQQVARLADQITVEQVSEVEPILADAATVLDLPRFATVCERVKAHVDPDGPDPANAFDQRTLSVTPVQGAVLVRGQLDPEGGAALLTALDAVTTPPGDGDDRTAGQRRADALAELARRQLTTGTLPTVGGQRPQVGVLLYPQALSPKTLERLAQAHQRDAAGARLRQFLTEPASTPAPEPTPAPASDWTRRGVTVDQDDLPTRAAGRTREAMLADLLGNDPLGNRSPGAAMPAEADPERAGPPRAGPPPADPTPADQPRAGPPPLSGAPAWRQPGPVDPPWLDWVGPIPPAAAQRIACVMPTSGGSSSTPPPANHSTSAVPTGWCRTGSVAPCTPGTAAAAGPDAMFPHSGRTRITGDRGPKAARPT